MRWEAMLDWGGAICLLRKRTKVTGRSCVWRPPSPPSRISIANISITVLGNIALLQRAQEAGLLPDHVGARAADAYRELRRVQHQARLNEAPTQVDPPALQAERDAVLALWKAVFG